MQCIVYVYYNARIPITILATAGYTAPKLRRYESMGHLFASFWLHRMLVSQYEVPGRAEKEDGFFGGGEAI